MTKDKFDTVERLCEKFTQLPDSEKSFVAGYMAGKEEERSKIEREKEQKEQTA